MDVRQMQTYLATHANGDVATPMIWDGQQSATTYRL